MTTPTTFRLEHDSYEILTDNIPLAGAQAAVFKVQRQRDGALLALKMAKNTDKTDGSTARNDRVRQEITFLRSLPEAEKHFIVPCLDWGGYPAGGVELPVFVMPFYDQTLNKAIADVTSPPSLQRRLRWIGQMATALAYIHQQKNGRGEILIHRDFKLDNMMLTGQDEIRLLDFGISKTLDQMDDGEGVATSMNYSPECVTPEQLLPILINGGLPQYALGPHTDMYALGLVIYKLFLGPLNQPASQLKLINEKEQLGKLHRDSLHLKLEGLLGKVGGLAVGESDALQAAFVGLAGQGDLQPVDINDPAYTYEEIDDEDAPSTVPADYQALAAQFASFGGKLLDANYQNRPSAMQAMGWVDSLIQGLDKPPSAVPAPKLPSVPTLKLDPQSTPIPVLTPAPMPLTVSALNVPNPPAHWRQQLSVWKAAIAVRKIPLLAFTVAALVGGGLIVWWNGVGNSPVAQFEQALYQGDAKQQSDAWRELHKLAKSEPAAQTVIDHFGQQLAMRVREDKPADWEKAIPGLKLQAERGDTNALVWLGYAYQNGKGVKVDWGEAWKYYAKAYQSGTDTTAQAKIQTKKAALEGQANSILHTQGSPLEQRELAYQVVGQIAQSIPSGDSAHLWMEHRYRTGDGVGVDLARAEQWKKRHDGIPTENIIKE